MKIDLACSSAYVTATTWLNSAYSISSADAHSAYLVHRLAPEDSTANLAYSSRVFEDIPQKQVNYIKHKCWNILKPGDVLKLAVTDLKNLYSTIFTLEAKEIMTSRISCWQGYWTRGCANTATMSRGA